MNALPLLVLLQAGEGEGSPFTMLVPMALIFMIFYFLLIRPQQKRQKEQETLLKSIEKATRQRLTQAQLPTASGSPC